MRHVTMNHDALFSYILSAVFASLSCAAAPAMPSFGGALSLPGVTLHPRAYDRNWRGWGAVTAAAPDDHATVRFRIKVDAKSAKTVFIYNRKFCKRR